MIDGDYRGEVRVLLFNNGNFPVKFSSGDRVAQMVVERVVRPCIEVSTELDPTVRGPRGFGSSGEASRPRMSVLRAGESQQAAPEEDRLSRGQRGSERGEENRVDLPTCDGSRAVTSGLLSTPVMKGETGAPGDVPTGHLGSDAWCGGA